MCGILGYISKNEINAFGQSLTELEHRGPDNWNFVSMYNDRAKFGHTRLSINDLSTSGAQPMVSCDETKVLMHNGEIYNHEVLRRKNNHLEFRSRSDSEVILQLYNGCNAKQLFSWLDGMFAIALVDVKKSRLILARDINGKKPLFYSVSNNQVCFASEIYPLLTLDPQLRKINSSALLEKFLTGSSQGTPDTIFNDIKKVLPGEIVTIEFNIDDRKLIKNIKRDYFTPSVNQDVIRYASDLKQHNPLDALDYLMEHSVKKRLMSDVSIGLQLSGGIDSSLLAYYLSNISENKFSSYCVTYLDQQGNPNSNDREFAATVANKYGLSHSDITINDDHISDVYDDMIKFNDGIIVFPNTIPMYLLSKEAKKDCSVLLSGEGADELFGGYNKYRTLRSLYNKQAYRSELAASLLGFRRSKWIYALRLLHLKQKYKDFSVALNHLNRYVTEEAFSKIFHHDIAKYSTEPSGDTLFNVSQMLKTDRKRYMVELLERQDRACMAAGVENRAPYCDIELQEVFSNLREDEVFHGKLNKKILSLKATEIFGSSFISRQKVGFPMPIHKWLAEGGFLNEDLKFVDSNEFAFKSLLKIENVQMLGNSVTNGGYLLNYNDRPETWIKWFLAQLVGLQRVFGIEKNDIY